MGMTFATFQLYRIVLVDRDCEKTALKTGDKQGDKFNTLLLMPVLSHAEEVLFSKKKIPTSLIVTSGIDMLMRLSRDGDYVVPSCVSTDEMHYSRGRHIH